MSAEAINVMNYVNPAQENPAASAMSKTDKDDKSFLKTLDDAQERISKDGIEQKKEDRHHVKRDEHKENKGESRDDRKVADKTPERGDEDSVEKDAEKEKNDNVKAAVIPLMSESLLANVDFGAVGDETAQNAVPVQTSAADKTAKNTTAVTDSTKTSDTVASTLKAGEAAAAKQLKEAAESIAAKVETEGTVVIKASDKVAAAAKETAVAQTQDMSSKAKDAAMANLRSIEGTDTTVVESESSSDSKNGTAFSQGNASEQIIKMSVENLQNAKPAGNESFSVQLDKQVQAPTQVQQPKELNKSDVMNQINQKLDEMHQQGNSKVTIILKPENLGRIHLEVMNTQDGITARMLTDNQQVKELLDKNMEALKSQLSAQGVNVNNIKIENAHQASNNAMNFERDQFGQNQSNHSNQNQSHQTSSGTNYENDASFEDFGDEQLLQAQQETIIKHDGKVDYKV